MGDDDEDQGETEDQMSSSERERRRWVLGFRKQDESEAVESEV